MPIDAVVRSVECPILVPTEANVAFERAAAHFRKGLDPIEALAVLSPEAVGIGERSLVEPEIIDLGYLADVRMGGNGDDVPARHGVVPPRMAAPARRRTLQPKTIPPC
jgi:hypothetical protein